MKNPEILNIFAEGIQALNLGLEYNYYLELDYPENEFVATVYLYDGEDNHECGRYGITEEDAELFKEFVARELGLTDTALDIVV